MLRVALTGGIATGKSHVLGRFTALGAPTIDADRLARDAVRQGQPAWEAIIRRFGRHLVRPDGSIDRAALAAMVFTDAEARRDLEAIVHPGIYAAIRAWFDGQARARAAIAVADIPLLFETGHEDDVDRIVVTHCPPDEQLARVRRRDGASAEQARRRLAAQGPPERKLARADYVVDTAGTMAHTNRQVETIYEQLVAEASRA